MTKFCIDSLINTTKRDSFDLVVVDNFSTDGTVEMLKEMKEKNIIDTLILNEKNLHLGKAVNQAWSATSENTDWLLWINNDFFFMDKWLDNLILVINDLDIDYVNCGYLEGISRHKVSRGISKKTENGGSYLEPVLRRNKSYDTGACPALKRSLVKAYNIQIPERPFSEGYTGPATVFYRHLNKFGFRGVRLNKPCILLQFPEYNNKLYKEYYDTTFKTRGLEKLLNFYKEQGHVKNPKKYYQGTNYLELYKKLNETGENNENIITESEPNK